MGNHRQEETNALRYETTGSVLILPVREAILFVLIVLVCGVILLWSIAFKFDSLEKKLDGQFERIAREERGQDIRLDSYEHDLERIVKATVGMWNEFIEEMHTNDKTQTTDE